jgi:hypothetical protein
MKLIAVLNARSLWWVNLVDLNPLGRSLYPALIPAIRDTYRFVKYPKSLGEIDERAGIKFEDGEFAGQSGIPLMLNLTIYSDGLMVDTRSNTKDSDAILEQSLTWLVRDFGLTYKSEMIRKRGYVSELHVYSDGPLEALNPGLTALAAKLKSLVPLSRGTVPFAPVGVTIGPDPDAREQLASFRFERVPGVPWSENRYYSIAPMQTDTHLELLNDFENVLIG